MELSKICAVCGKAFVTRRPNKRTCSTECSVELERRRARKNNKAYAGVCKECGKDFVGVKGQALCSIACRAKYLNRTKGKKKCRCAVCNSEFWSICKSEYCSDNCQVIAQNMGVVRKRRTKKKRDALSDYALRAREAGMSYGQYVGQEYIAKLRKEGKYWCQN